MGDAHADAKFQKRARQLQAELKREHAAGIPTAQDMTLFHLPNRRSIELDAVEFAWLIEAHRDGVFRVLGVKRRRPKVVHQTFPGDESVEWRTDIDGGTLRRLAHSGGRSGNAEGHGR
jgi:hypothetical protein